MRVGVGLLAACFVSILLLGAGSRGSCVAFAESPPPPRARILVYGARSNGTANDRERAPGRKKRSVVQLASMLRCVTGCSPLAYKGYGCYCGYMGSGLPVDEIDRCCLEHDWCYTHISCPQLLVYFVPYRWTCAAPGYPQCEIAASSGMPAECALQLCECDRAFAKCVRNFPCPKYKAMCRSTNYITKAIMGRK